MSKWPAAIAKKYWRPCSSLVGESSARQARARRLNMQTIPTMSLRFMRVGRLDPGSCLESPSTPVFNQVISDATGPLLKATAEALLKSGFEKGMVSEQRRSGWPQNVWAVSLASEPFEAQLENPERGVYHGYPMPLDDDFRDVVLEEWKGR